MKTVLLALLFLFVSMAGKGQTIHIADTASITVSELQFIIFSTHKSVKRLEKRIRRHSFTCCTQNLYPGATLILTDSQNQRFGTYANESGVATFDTLPAGIYQLTVDVPYHIPLVFSVDYNPNHGLAALPPFVIVLKNLVHPRTAF